MYVHACKTDTGTEARGYTMGDFFLFFLENALFVTKHIYFATDKCQALGDLTISFAWRVGAGPYGVRCVRKNAIFAHTPGKG